MANRRKLYVDWTTRRLHLSDTDATIVTIGTLYKYESVPFEIAIIEPVPNSLGAYSRLDVDSISLSVALSSTLDTNSPMALQETWTKNSEQNVFTGELDLNTVAANAYIGSTASKTAYFEIQVIDGNGKMKAYAETIAFTLGLLSTAVASPSPAGEYYTKGQSDGRYMQQMMAAGATLTLRSPNGQWDMVIGCADDGTMRTDFLPVT